MTVSGPPFSCFAPSSSFLPEQPGFDVQAPPLLRPSMLPVAWHTVPAGHTLPVDLQ